MSPQTATVLNHLTKNGSISPVEAAAVHRIRHLPARIHELKHKFGRKIVAEQRKDATGQRYVRYRLDETVGAAA
jgi:hypothetical protein